MKKGYHSSAYILGHYGMQNTSDDALMAATILGSQKWLGIDQLFASSPKEIKFISGANLSASIVNHQRFYTENQLRSYFKAANSQRVIFGGGSNFKSALDINLKRDLMMLGGGRSHLAQRLGSFKNDRAERACAKFLNERAYTGLRESMSFDIAKAIAPNADLEKTFYLTSQLSACGGVTSSNIERQRIGVYLSPKERLKGGPIVESKRLKRLATALETDQYLTNEEICFIDFNPDPELRDKSVYQELASYLPYWCKYRFLDHDPTPFRTPGKMAHFKFVLSMSMQASIFCFVSNTPLISDKKESIGTNWLEQIGRPQSNQFNVKDFDSNEIINVVIDGLNFGSKLPKMNVNKVLKLSMKSWRKDYE